MSENENNFGQAVVIQRIHHDTNTYVLEIDISLQKQMIDIRGVTVSKENGFWTFGLPCVAVEPWYESSNIRAIRFIENDEWSRIRKELECELTKIKWVMSFFDGQNE